MAENEKPDFFKVETSEEILARKKAVFLESWNEQRSTRPDLDLPEYDTINLETNPIVAAVEAAGFGERLFLETQNKKIRAAVLRQEATGAELDAHGEAFNVFRMPDETDTRYLLRQNLWLNARGRGGVDEYWQYFALTADIRVVSCDVSRAETDVLKLTIKTDETNGAPSEEVLQIVRSYLAGLIGLPKGVSFRVLPFAAS